MTVIVPAAAGVVDDKEFDAIKQAAGFYGKRAGTVYYEARDESGSADSKHWRMEFANGTMKIVTANDANDTAATAYTITRSGNSVTKHEMYVGGSAVATFTSAGLAGAVAATTLSSSGNTTLGDATGDSLTINAGTLSAPNIPAVCAYVSNADQANVTGDSTNYAVIFDTEVYDQGADYNTTTGTFTAPVSGIYHVATAIRIGGFTANHLRGQISIVTSNQGFAFGENSPNAVKSSDPRLGYFAALDVYMDAADTCQVKILIESTDKTIDIEAASYLSIRQVA